MDNQQGPVDRQAARGLGAPGTTTGAPAARGASQDIDVERLADKVYQLMLTEVRLERARDGR